MGFNIKIQTPLKEKKKLYFDKNTSKISDILIFIYNEELNNKKKYEDIDNPTWYIKIETTEGDMILKLKSIDELLQYEF